MIRCGQMMLCQAIKRHMFESFSFQWTNPEMLGYYQRILEMFEDDPQAAFGIHKVCAKSRKTPGEWLGPQTTSGALKELVYA